MLVLNRQLGKPDFQIPLANAPKVKAFFHQYASDHATPFPVMKRLADQLQIGQLWIKDESKRLGLGSFKALGGAYAVSRVLATQAQKGVPIVTCATDGNHGRSVAFGAKLLGAQAIIFVHEGVSQGRCEALKRLGAEVMVVPGTYDDAVAEASRQAKANDWLLVSDTAKPGYEQVPMDVMTGYTLMVREMLDQADTLPTHVFLQAGVGGMAAAVTSALATVCDAKIIVVEPDRAPCLQASVLAGQATKIQPQQATVMAMLECYEPSSVAWNILSKLATGFLTITDTQCIEAMKVLAKGEPYLESGESGAAGLAGIQAVLANPEWRSQLGLTEHSVVWLINTEGATDPEIYQSLVNS